MRTRFLNIDYFNSSPNKTLETLTFFHLPLTHLAPFCLSDFEEDLRCCFDSDCSFERDLEILPINGVLSKFFSEVLPQKIDVHIGEFSDDLLEIGNDCVSTGSDETQLLEKANDTTIDYKDEHEFKPVQFETHQLDLITIDASFSEKEEMELLSEDLEANTNLDMLISKLQMQYPYEVQESVYSVETITSGYHIDKKFYVLEDAGSDQDQNHCCSTFPLFEVGEISPGLSLRQSLEDEFLLLLENIEPQLWTQNNDLMVDGKELVASVDINLLEIYPDHCLKKCLDSDMACLNLFLDIDFLSIKESSNIQGNSAFHKETSGGESYVSVSPLLFQEFQILDVDSSQSFEIFSNHLTIDEPEICDQMLMEDMNLRSFNELIVSHELALADDTFKSLPVPIFSDHENLNSLYVIVEEILEDIKPQPLSATDGIYLDWHLLEDDKCDHDRYCTHQNVLKDMNTYSIDFDLKYIDDRNLILDFVFSDVTSHEPNMIENKESLNMLPGGISMLDAHLAGVGSKTKLDNRCPKPGNAELSSDSNAERVSLLFESMSQFSDLDYFLNPRKVTSEGKIESVSKAFDTKATFPMVQSSRSIAEKVELEDSSMSKSNDIPQHTGFTMEGQPHFVLALDENMNNHKLKKRLDTIPMKDKRNLRSLEAADVEACSIPLPVPCAPQNVNLKQVQSSLSSSPDKIIIVNTQNFDMEMIISRRSTYQRILAMEKEGAQVVERDLNLPVDIIISAAACLVWYHSRNISKKATPTDEASSSLPLCLENIATNVLTMLSFTFSSCILIFEGDVSFITATMESSDGLYAAAATLGVDLQLFNSYSSELTDEIILNSIEQATKLTRGLYPRMPESETLAESFLMQFPSINPLSAHAVLSSGCMLAEFLELPHERRMQSIMKYHVPEESVTLLSSLCRYGEREDSKSGMTDCSSSVSSAPDSEYCHYKTNSERKKQKFTRSPKNVEIPINDVLNFEPLYPSRVSKQYDSGMSNGLENINDIQKPSLSLDDKLFDQNQGSDRAMGKHINWHDSGKSDILHEDFMGEVSDLNDRSLFDENFSSLPNSGIHSIFVEREKKVSDTRKFKSARRLSFGKSSDHTFPAASKISYCSDIWDSVKDHKHNLNQDISGYSDTDFNIDNMPLIHRRELSGEGSKQNSAMIHNELSFQEKNVPHYRSDMWNSVKDHTHNLNQDINRYSNTGFNIDNVPLKHRREPSGEGSKQSSAKRYNETSFYEKGVSNYGGTPLRNAISSSQLQQGSPWTIEFLNRIREKSRLRQQSLPCDISAPDFGHSGNIAKINKRKSPSILDFYKYQGGSASKRMEQKRQKRSVQPSASFKNEKSSVPFPTWTPLDKRARQTLSFAMNGSGSQAKLVWSDENVQSLNKRF